MSGECYFPFESLHCIFVCLFYFILSLSILCVYATVKCLFQVRNVLSLNCMCSGALLLAYCGTPNRNHTVILVLQAKQNAHQICLLLFTFTSIWLVVSLYHFSSVRQYGRNTTEHYDSADLYKYRKAEVHTLAGVCTSTALGRPDAQLQRWCIT